jgi:hypothetical protein
MPLVGAAKRNARMEHEVAGPSWTAGTTTGSSGMVDGDGRRRGQREESSGDCDDCCDECCGGLIDWFCCLGKERE